MCIRSQETEHFNVVFPQPFETGLMTVNSSYASRSKPTQFAHLPLSSHCSSCELLTSPSGAVCFRQTLTVSLPELPASTTSSMERNETIYPQTTLKRGYRYYPLSLWKDTTCCRSRLLIMHWQKVCTILPLANSFLSQFLTLWPKSNYNFTLN